MRRPGVQRAVIPAAGWGTRLLPITKVVPKELLPFGSKPLIQHAVEQVVRAGIREIAIVINSRKEVIREYFLGQGPFSAVGNPLEELEALLASCRLTFLYQEEARGVAHAIYQAKAFTQGEPFAVVMPDNLYVGPRPPLAQLLPIFEARGRDLMALQRIGRRLATTYGNCGLAELKPEATRLYRLLRLYPKRPGYLRPRRAAWLLRTSPPELHLSHYFDYIEAHLEAPDLDDVPILQRLVREQGVWAYLIRGRIYDLGNPRGYLAALKRLKVES